MNKNGFNLIGYYKWFVCFLLCGLSGGALAGIEACGETPEKHNNNRFSAASYAVVKPCLREMSKDENLFVAGLSMALARSCGFPKSPELRKRLSNFHQSSMLVAGLGAQYTNPDFSESMSDSIAGSASLSAGVSAGEALGCNAQSHRIAKNIARYFSRPAPAEKEDSSGRFVKGCVNHYAHSYKYSESQCQCLADNGRAVIPNIHGSNFSTATIKKIISANPMLGISLAVKCKINNY